jgi:hypothetical protein
VLRALPFLAADDSVEARSLLDAMREARASVARGSNSGGFARSVLGGVVGSAGAAWNLIGKGLLFINPLK